MIAIFVGIGLVLLHLAGIFVAMKAIGSARTPQGAVGWVVFLLAAPYVAIPAYLFLGHSRFPGYVAARRASRGVRRAIRDFGEIHAAHAPPVGEIARRSIVGFEKLTAMPVVSGNDVRLLIDGDDTFAAMFDAIERAQSYVLVQFYILRSDKIGRAFQALLIERANAGCTVRVLYDALGSQGLARSYIEELRAAGVVIHDFHSIRRARSRLQLNFRNHRKIVIVDGEIGLVGGLNIGDEYTGGNPKIGHWRDTHVLLKGPVVAQLQLIFMEDWDWATEERLELNWEPSRQASDLDALIVATGPADQLETGSLYFCNAIVSARQRIWIASPYFVPDTDVLSALKLAAVRGVDVRVLAPANRDHLFAWLAAFAYFDEVREAGVKILRYTDGFMHQKVILIDDAIASVGTINLDNRSCRLNFEVTAIVHDPGFAEEVARMLEADFEKSSVYEETLDKTSSRFKRYGAPAARLLAPLL